MDESTEIRILHVDDHPEFVDMAARFLERADDRFIVETTTSADDGLRRLADGEFDCIVSDYEMPESNGIEFLETVREDHCDLPFILFTGKGSEEVASDAISAGATDYLRKGSGTDQYELLANRIRNAVEQSRAQQAVVETEHRLQTIAEHTNDVLWQFAADWDELLFINSAYEAIWGRSIDELHDAPRSFLEGVHPDDRPVVRDAMGRLSAGESVDFEFRVNAGEDYGRWVWVQGEPVFGDDGAVASVVGFARDITDRKERRQQLERERDRFSAIFEAIPEPVVQVRFRDDRPIVKNVNSAFVETFGHGLTDVEGESINDVVVPEEYRDEARQLDAAVRTQDTVEEEVERLAADGRRPFLFRSNQFEVTDGTMESIGVYIDLTEARNRERALEQLQERTQALMHTATKEETAQVAVETAHDVLGAPLSGCHLVDPDRQTLEPTAFVDTVREELGTPPTYHRSPASDPASQVVWQVFETGDALVIDDTREYGGLADVTPARSAILHPLDGTGVFIVSATEPNAFDDSDKALTEIIVTSLKAAFERVERERTLERQNERLTQFTNVVSHDLRNPLNVVQGRLELAREDCDSEHLDAATGAARRSLSLLDDLLAVARDGERARELESVDLPAVVDRCWTHIETPNAVLTTETEQTILADQSRLEQLLENLFRNAVEHAGDDVTVTVGALDDGDGFFVADDGPGIPESERGDVFEAGYSTTETGTGFGLNIVREIADAHDWTITVTDSETGGARFELTGVEPDEED